MKKLNDELMAALWMMVAVVAMIIGTIGGVTLLGMIR